MQESGLVFPMPGTQLIYLDYQATTPCDPRVVEAMTPFWTEQFVILDSAFRLRHDDFYPFHGRRRPQFWLDILRTVVNDLRTTFGHILYFRRSLDGRFFHNG